MQLDDFLTQLKNEPNTITFADTMATIDANYTFTPTAFYNGLLSNAANQNNGSCKIFALGLLNRLTAEQTLACFGDYYRKDVLEHPEGNDHQNIRNFMQTGWDGIRFAGKPLALK